MRPVEPTPSPWNSDWCGASWFRFRIFSIEAVGEYIYLVKFVIETVEHSSYQFASVGERGDVKPWIMRLTSGRAVHLENANSLTWRNELKITMGPKSRIESHSSWTLTQSSINQRREEDIWGELDAVAVAVARSQYQLPIWKSSAGPKYR